MTITFSACTQLRRPIRNNAITALLGAATLVLTSGLFSTGPATAATPDRRAALETAGIPRIDDYAAAGEAARAAQAMLLVSVEPTGGDPTDMAGQRLEQADVQERFLRSGTPWVFCRIGIPEAGVLVADPSLVEMRRGPGVFVVDHTGGPLTGRIVSILPRRSGKYYRFSPSHIDQLASLPSGSLTQRSLILAVRIHPENPQSTYGFCNPMLCQEAAAHSAHQARIRTQGHHNWASGRNGLSAMPAAPAPPPRCALRAGKTKTYSTPASTAWPAGGSRQATGMPFAAPSRPTATTSAVAPTESGMPPESSYGSPASKAGSTKILPSPIRPVRAMAVIRSTTSSTRASSTHN